MSAVRTLAIRARAPVRIDFAGGWTDVAAFCRDSPGAVVNAAISIHSYATVLTQEVEPDRERLELRLRRRIQDASVSIYSSDFDLAVQAKTIRDLEYDGNVDLVKAALRRLELPGGCTVITRSDAPPGSGLGTSAAMGVALLAALARMGGRPLVGHALAELACSIEREELGILGGKQDHYASALGGVSLMEFEGEFVRASPLRLSRDTILELEKNLVVCYTGTSRLSGDIHAHVAAAYANGNRDTVAAVEGLKQTARETCLALQRGDMERFGALLTANWEYQQRLHPSVSSPAIDELFALARREGAVGGKACGAGGGGCLLFYCLPEREHCVRRALEQAGVRLLDFVLDFLGVETWQTHFCRPAGDMLARGERGDAGPA